MESTKPNILILTDWFVPGYKAGGPIQSVNNLVNALEGEVNFSIVTGDRDLMDDTAYEGVPFDEWTVHGQHRRHYATAAQLPALLQKELVDERYDAIYFNSFFSSSFTIKPLLLLRKLKRLDKVILAPRGMLGKGALSVKPLKKRAFIALFNAMGIGKRVHFHSTDASETKDIKAALGTRIQVSTLPNIPVQPVKNAKTRLSGDTHAFIYASRLSPKKNPLCLLQLMQAMEADFKLDLYGTVDDQAYFDKCRAIITAEPEYFEHHEAVAPAELYVAVRQADFFVLPTLNENFGHAIIEALAHGTPVMISDQTPWNDLEAFGAGWVVPLSDKKRWQEVLSDACAMEHEDYAQMSTKALEYVRSKFDFAEIRKRYLNLFRATH